MKKLWSSSLVTKVFLSYLAVIILLFASFYLFSTSELRKQQIRAIGESMIHEARFLARLLPAEESGPSLESLCRRLGDDFGSRITVIAPDGNVLCDSVGSSTDMESHDTRPEVAEARRTGTGTATRYSTTVHHEMLYQAIQQNAPGGTRIIRVAKPLKEIESEIQSIRWSMLSGLLFASALGLLLAWLFSRYLSRRLGRLEQFAEQVSRGTFPQNFFSNGTRDEISLLEQRLNAMSRKIRDHLQEVVAEKEKSESILRCMIEGVLVLDPQGRVLVMNDQARSMFDVSPGRDIHGVPMPEISRHPEIHTILQEVSTLAFTDRRYSKEVELEGERCFRVNAVSLSNVRGQPVGSILVFHDITDIKRFEAMRTDFVANVSHELRTPLTAIRGYVETLLDSPPSDPEDSRQFLEIIERHAERLSRLTEDLLTLSDLESGKVQLTLRPLDANQLISRVLEIFWDRAAKKQIKLAQESHAAVPQLRGDLDRLQQLFINLVDNAIKYTPPGGTVTLSAARAAADNGAPPRVEIAVRDTGPGIAEKDLPRLTERFYRVDKARSRDLGGTGLGLAIVKHIVQAHHGELKIESTLHRGTTVRVRLPAAAVNGGHRSAILFLCTANSCRSQMAEGFARRRAANRYEVYSAGTAPTQVHPLAVLVMQEAGIDITAQYSKSLAAVPLDRVERIVTLCGDANEQCPVLPRAIERTHWPIADPAAAQGTEEEILAVFRKVRDEIDARVEELLPSNSKSSSRTGR